MRIAIVHRDRCHPPVKCGTECILYCPPRVRTGDETVVIGEDQKAVISEELCVGCGICVKKCPFQALDIVNLPPEQLDQPTHRYGQNGFVLYGLPIPVEGGKVTGILGPNGIGKSTSVKILSGTLVPNLGRTDAGISWKEVLDLYQGTELFDYLQLLSQKNVKVAVKPQYIDQIPKVFSGSVHDLLATTDERGKLDYYIDRLTLKAVIDRPITTLSGGELQRVALAACLARDADFYFFDEITPYLDVYQRMAAANLIRELALERPVVIVEHDLAILDMLADTVHIAYGEPAVFGVITHPKGVRVGINQYLEGFLPEENVRFRTYAVTFDTRAHAADSDREVLFEFPAMTKAFEQFSLTVDGGGEIRSGEVLGVLGGANGIGKSTFAQLLAGGVLEPDTGAMDTQVRISYKPPVPQRRYGGDRRGAPPAGDDEVRHVILPARDPGTPPLPCSVPPGAGEYPLRRRTPAGGDCDLPLARRRPLHPGRAERPPRRGAAGEDLEDDQEACRGGAGREHARDRPRHLRHRHDQRPYPGLRGQAGHQRQSRRAVRHGAGHEPVPQGARDHLPAGQEREAADQQARLVP